MDDATLSLLTGPTSSLLLLLGMGLGLWRFTTQTVLPAAKIWVDRHLDQVDELLKQHAKDRETWLQSMQDCHARAERMGAQLDTIERKIGGLYARHEALAGTLDGRVVVDNGVAS